MRELFLIADPVAEGRGYGRLRVEMAAIVRRCEVVGSTGTKEKTGGTGSQKKSACSMPYCVRIVCVAVTMTSTLCTSICA